MSVNFKESRGFGENGYKMLGKTLISMNENQTWEERERGRLNADFCEKIYTEEGK